MLKNALSALCLLKEWMDLTKPAQIYHWEMQKKLLHFGDLNHIFKFTGQKMLKNALSALYLLKGWMDFNQHWELEKN